MRRRHLRGGGIYDLFVSSSERCQGTAPNLSRIRDAQKGCANPLATIQRFLLNELYPSLPLEMGVAIPSFLSHC